jgi:hypothetical protein
VNETVRDVIMSKLEDAVRAYFGVPPELPIGFIVGELVLTCCCGLRPTLNLATPPRCPRCRRFWRK